MRGWYKASALLWIWVVSAGLFVETASGDQGGAPAVAPPAEGQQTSPPPPAGPAPKAVVDKPVFDWGEIWSGDRVEHTFEIRNEGQANLEITNVRAACGCTATEYDKVIEPGKTGKVKAVVTTARMQGKLSKPIYVTTNDPALANKPITLTMEGTAKPRITVTPMQGADFGRVASADNPEPRRVTLTNNTDQPMKIELQDPNAQHPVFKVAVEEKEAGKVYDVIFTPQRPFVEGPNFATVVVKTGVEAEPTIPIQARLFSPPLVEVSPESMVLGAPPAREMPRTFEIRYNGDGALKIESVSSSDDAVKVALKEFEPGKRYQVTAMLPAGYQPAPESPLQIRVKTDNPQRPELVLPILMRTSPGPGQLIAEAMVGHKPPQTTVPTLGGPVVSVAGGEGKVSMVGFWVSWGQDSTRLLPLLQRVTVDYRRRGVDVLMINCDEMRPVEAIAERVRQLNVNLPIGLDPQRQVAGMFGVQRFPALFLIGKTGTIEAVHMGAGRTQEDNEAFAAYLRIELDALLEGKDRESFPILEAPLRILAMDIPDNVQLTQPDVPLIAVESMRIDTGRHKPGQTVKTTFYLKNRGHKTLNLTALTGGDGVKVDPEVLRTIEPGVTSPVTVEFPAPPEPGEFIRMVSIASNDATRTPLQVTLVGTSRAYIEVDPPGGVDFSRVPRLHSMPRLVTLAYNGPGTIEYTAVESSSPKFTARVEPIPNTPYAKMTIESVPPFEPGENRAVLRVRTTSPQQPVVEIPVTLFVPPRLEVRPSEITIHPGSRIRQSTVQIINNGQQSLNVLGLTRSNDQLVTQFFPASDGMSYELKITFPIGYVPPPDGDRITIRTDDQEMPEIVVPIRAHPGGHAAARPQS